MPVHDWTKVEAGIFPDFHTAFLTEIRNILNNRVLPQGYYALTEQHAGRFIADVLTLRALDPLAGTPAPQLRGGLALADAPPRVRRKLTISPAPRTRRRTLAIRHVSGHCLVALIEVVSPANKDRQEHVDEFATKVASALNMSIHVLMIDLFACGSYDPRGMHGAIQRILGDGEDSDPENGPVDEPLAVVSYVAGTPIEA
jgi:hypothetical protein